jgi:hypothetical protein
VVAHATVVLEDGFTPNGFDFRDPHTWILLGLVLLVDTAFLAVIWVAHYSKKDDTVALVRNICAMSWFKQLEDEMFTNPVRWGSSPDQPTPADTPCMHWDAGRLLSQRRQALQ